MSERLTVSQTENKTIMSNVQHCKYWRKRKRLRSI